GPLPARHAVGAALPRCDVHRVAAHGPRLVAGSDGDPALRQDLEGRVSGALAAPLLVALLGAPAGGAPTTGTSPSAKETALWDRLKDRISAVDKGLDGVLGVWVKDLRAGRTIEVRAGEVFPTASSIKIAVLYETYRQAAEGTLDLGEV